MLCKKRIALCSVLGLAAVALIVPWNMVAANDNHQRLVCDLRGSWVGQNDAGDAILVTYHGDSRNEGTDDVEWIVQSNPTLGGIFPDAVRWSTNRGVWTRTGHNQFDYTLVGYALNALGGIEYSYRYSGTKTLIDCDTMLVTSTTELFLPGQIPVEGRACFVRPEGLGINMLHRIKQEPVCQ